MGRILIGLCSWTDRTLIESGRFYPAAKMSAEARLRWYAGVFPHVEADSPYYALPSVGAARLWVERTPPDFLFHVKAFRAFTGHWLEHAALPRDLLTHMPPTDKARIYYRDLPRDVADELWRRFSDALRPLHDAGKLGLVLFQFPNWVTPGERSREHILLCKAHLPGYRLAVEFRNEAWFSPSERDATLAFLRQHGLTHVVADEPQVKGESVPLVPEVTTDVAYIRFHGRNKETWSGPKEASWERFNYWYSPEDMDELTPVVRALAERSSTIYALFNNNYRDQGVQGAMLLARKLGIQLPLPQMDALPLPEDAAPSG